MVARYWFWVLILGVFAPLFSQRVVVPYVSLDEEHSRSILELFEKESGISVKPVFDTEDNKTVGLVNRLIAERSRPRADVYWNNECGQTVRLGHMGLLDSYRPLSAKTIPASFKDAGGLWTGFAARARVLIYNTEMIRPEDLPRRLEDLARPEFASRLIMAKPLTGTTLTHVAALFSVWGERRTKQWIDALIAGGTRWERGNAQVMREVGKGTRPFGLTDTDDARVSVLLDKKKTATIFLDQEEGGLGTLIIPNTVMIMKGAPHLAEARALVDFLASPRVEALLAAGTSGQMPLHPEVEVPAGVSSVSSIVPMTVDFEAVGKELEKRVESLSLRFDGLRGGGAKGQEGGGESGGFSLLLAMFGLLVAIVLIGLLLRQAS